MKNPLIPANLYLAVSFHQSNKVMKIPIFVFLLLSSFSMACQQGQEMAPQQLAAASMDFISDSIRNTPEKGESPAANIVLQSTDGGQSWQDVSLGLPSTLRPQGVFVGGGEVFLSSGNGLYRSSCNSEAPAWKHTAFLQGRILDVFPGRTSLYACSYELGLFRTIYGTDFWQDITTTLKDKTVRSVLETREGTLLVGSDKGIYKSADGGQSWKQVYDGGMVLNLTASGEVLIGGGLPGVLRSTDGGENWENVLNMDILAKNTGLIGDRFFTVLGTRDPRKISPEGITSQLRTSEDGGKTWQRIDQAPLPVQGMYEMDEDLSQVRDIYDIIQAGDYLFCSFDTGIYRSSDQGKSWELVLPSNDKLTFNNLVVSGQVIYAVQGGGC